MTDKALTIDDLILKYAGHLKALNRAERTIHAQVVRLKRFYDFARNVQHVTDITQSILLDYQKYLSEYINERGTPNSILTQNHHLSVVAGFYRYLKQAGYVAHNPTLELEYATAPQRLPRAILNIKEMKKLLRQPDTGSVLGFRDRTIMEVLYSSGIRRNELINLNLEDLDLESGFIMVRQGKGRKDRVVPLGKVACRYLETYINGIRPELMKYCPVSNNKAVFPSRRGERLSKNCIGAFIAKYARRAGIKQSVSPHTFRHSFATHLVRNNAGIRHVQEMLGHVDLTTTQKYIKLTMNDLKAAHSKYHPREKDK